MVASVLKSRVNYKLTCLCSDKSLSVCNTLVNALKWKLIVAGERDSLSLVGKKITVKQAYFTLMVLTVIQLINLRSTMRSVYPLSPLMLRVFKAS